MKYVVLMTTYNRPHLLKQSLPQIEREAMSIGADLYIHDDQSSNIETLAMLAEAETRGVTVFRRPYVRQETNLTDHELTGMANYYAFKYLIEEDKSWSHLIKVDDDTYWANGAMRSMDTTFRQCLDDGVDVVLFSGISTTNEPELRDHGSYAITRGACHAAVIIDRQDLESFISKVPIPYIVNDGYDTCFMYRWVNIYRPDSEFVSIKPSVVYHTGMNGVHISNLDVNRNFVGAVDDIVKG